MIIDGKIIAEKLLKDLKAKPGNWREKFFGAMLVGDDPASINFLKQKAKIAKELGISFRLYKVPEGTSTDDLRAEIHMLSKPKNCGGFIVQLPLPDSVNKHYVLNAIPKEKDVDCLGEKALGAFYTGRGKVAPPAVEAVDEILRAWSFPPEADPSLAEERGAGNGGDSFLRGLKFVLVGAGFLIGKPVGFWLQNRAGEVTILDSSVKNVKGKVGDADVVVCGAGQANLFSGHDLKEGALVIDFGFNKRSGEIIGDFNPEGVEEKNITYTKTPGGTGPVLVAELYENFWKLNK